MGIRLWGRPVYSDESSKSVLQKFELDKVNPEELREGMTVLVKLKIKQQSRHNRDEFIEAENYHYFKIKDVIAILPGEVREEVKETIDDIKDRFKKSLEDIENNAVKTGIGIASVSPEEFFKTEQKGCENCGIFNNECRIGGEACVNWKPKEQPKEEIDFEGLKIKGYVGQENDKQYILVGNDLDRAKNFNKLVTSGGAMTNDRIKKLFNEWRGGMIDNDLRMKLISYAYSDHELDIIEKNLSMIQQNKDARKIELKAKREEEPRKQFYPMFKKEEV